jgi:hypothetical protein
MTKDFAEEERGDGSGGGCAGEGDKVSLFAEAVDDDENAVVVVVGHGKIEEIHSDLLPLALGDGDGLEEPRWALIGWFVALTVVTGVDVSTNIECKAGPEVGALYEARCFVATEMSRNRIVVTEMDDAAPKVVVIRNPDATGGLVFVEAVGTECFIDVGSGDECCVGEVSGAEFFDLIVVPLDRGGSREVRAT